MNTKTFNLIDDIKNVASEILEKDISLVKGFNNRQVEAISKQALIIKAGIATGEIEDDLIDFFLDGLKHMLTNFINTLKGILKVILETCYLEELEIIKASELAIQSGADYIKTSTGFGVGGATIHDVKLMKIVAEHCNTKIKASGGIRDYKTAMEFIELGVERLGVSSGIAIMNGEQSKSDY